MLTILPNQQALLLVTYFNGKPVDCADENDNSGMDARFCFPEIMAEMDYDIHATSQKFLSMGSSEFAPPSISNASVTSILYKEEEEDAFDATTASSTSSNGIPQYLHEQPFVLTELSRQQFGQCVFLGLLNWIGIIWVQNALIPGGMFELPTAVDTGKSRRRKESGRGLITAASFLILGLLKILRFYAALFFVLPLCRLVIVLIRNNCVARRNGRRQQFIGD